MDVRPLSSGRSGAVSGEVGINLLGGVAAKFIAMLESVRSLFILGLASTISSFNQCHGVLQFSIGSQTQGQCSSTEVLLEECSSWHRIAIFGPCMLWRRAFPERGVRLIPAFSVLDMSISGLRQIDSVYLSISLSKPWATSWDPFCRFLFSSSPEWYSGLRFWAPRSNSANSLMGWGGSPTTGTPSTA